MISRRTAHLIAEIYEGQFKVRTQEASSHGTGAWHTYIDYDSLYDYLFVDNYSAWFCNLARKCRYPRSLQDFIMKIHTGESLVPGSENWDWKRREKLGQQYLIELARSILNHWKQNPPKQWHPQAQDSSKKLLANLQLDGYQYRDFKLYYSENDILDVEEESGVIRSLYHTLKLGKEETVFHHLRLSEEHYIAGKWDDSISNSRKFLESTLSNIAASHSTNVKASPLPSKTLEKPFEVRDYLTREGLIEAKEKDALSSVYGLLSHTGGHPYMADNDQARLLRHMALTLTQFILLRYQGCLEALGK